MQYRSQTNNKMTTSTGKTFIHQIFYSWSTEEGDFDPKGLQSSSAAYHNARDKLIDIEGEMGDDYRYIHFYGYRMIDGEPVICTQWVDLIDLTEASC